MDFTSRMQTLLTAFRRERNGEAAGSMRYYGADYGLNYGVSLPTLRRIARSVGTDSDFARYLYVQEVRELQLAAYWIADPCFQHADEASFWAAGILNSEMAEEAGFALLSRVPRFESVLDSWTAPGAPLLVQYAALLGAARHPELSPAWLGTVAKVVHRNPDDRLTAQGVVALLAALGQKEENRSEIIRLLGSLGTSPSADLIHEETTWRLEA